jgi:hypothetical protein
VPAAATGCVAGLCREFCRQFVSRGDRSRELSQSAPVNMCYHQHMSSPACAGSRIPLPSTGDQETFGVQAFRCASPESAVTFPIIQYCKCSKKNRHIKLSHIYGCSTTITDSRSPRSSGYCRSAKERPKVYPGRQSKTVSSDLHIIITNYHRFPNKRCARFSTSRRV